MKQKSETITQIISLKKRKENFIEAKQGFFFCLNYSAELTTLKLSKIALLPGSPYLFRETDLRLCLLYPVWIDLGTEIQLILFTEGHLYTE